MSTVSFSEDINNDCKVLILSFLPAEDMNSFAFCSQACRRVRRHESLDQTRTATLIVSEKTTTQSFLNKIRENRRIFTGNRSRLKLVGLEKISASFAFQTMRSLVVLPQVTHLDCSCEVPTPFEIPDEFTLVRALPIILPSLQVLDWSNFLPDLKFLKGFSHLYWPYLSNIKWKGLKGITQCGHNVSCFRNMTRLCVDKAVFAPTLVLYEPSPGGGGSFTTVNNPSDNIPNFFMFMNCSNLQSLSLKGATLMVPDAENVPLPQEMLVTMVRRHPSLKWLKSDLTPGNVQMLKQERPDITYVS